MSESKSAEKDSVVDVQQRIEREERERERESVTHNFLPLSLSLSLSLFLLSLSSLSFRVALFSSLVSQQHQQERETCLRPAPCTHTSRILSTATRCHCYKNTPSPTLCIPPRMKRKSQKRIAPLMKLISSHRNQVGFSYSSSSPSIHVLYSEHLFMQKQPSYLRY